VAHLAAGRHPVPVLIRSYRNVRPDRDAAVSAPDGSVLWTPPENPDPATQIIRYLRFLERRHGLRFDDYEALRLWSIGDLEAFWGSLWEFFEIRASSPYERVLGAREMPGAVWFEGARLNYAEHALGREEDRRDLAVLARSQTRGPIDLTFGELREQVAAARAGLRRLGVGPGDRVVGNLPNIPETLVAFLACASLGAIWAVCPPEFGARSVINRFAMLEPKILFAVAAYRYGTKPVDRRGEVATVREALPSVEHVIHVPYLGGAEDSLPGALAWETLLAQPGPLEFEQVAFDHPLWVLFSSGTTGLPKAIVQSHGGILLEHLKNNGLSWDVRPGDRVLWFTTTAWMMWNALVSMLALRASFVMLDGNPLYPDMTAQFQLARELRPTMMGVSPALLMSCRKAGVALADFGLGSLRQLCTAGSPLPGEGFDYVYDELGPEIHLNNGSGGTDVCTGIVQGGPLQPVYRGEISGRLLGVDVAAYDSDGREVVGELGELVIRQPMPSMPLCFWNDPDAVRYRDSYFGHYPGVWRHGDWIVITKRGSCVITGRSDATLNRGGVRLGTGEFYAIIDELREIRDSLVIHLEDPGGGPGELILFVVLADGVTLDDALRQRIAGALRGALSPRHVPDAVEAVPAIPQTLTGKKLELPVKRIMLGSPPELVASRDALADPHALDAFVELAAARAAAGQRAG